MLKGTYMNRSNGAKATKWRMEGAPSGDGPNEGRAAGTFILIKPHIGITAPRLPIRAGFEPEQLV